jgi:hypothetical protein
LRRGGGQGRGGRGGRETYVFRDPFERKLETENLVAIAHLTMFQSSLWLKWRILLIVLPFTALFVLCKWVVYFQHWDNWSFDALASALVAATTFVTAFVLSGILSDYKLSEALPTDICASIEAIADCNRFEAIEHPNYDPKPLQEALATLLQEIHNWLVERSSFDPVLDGIAGLSKWFVILGEFTPPPLIGRLQGEQAKLRQIAMRIHMIRETNFVAPAYAILELFTAATIFSLLFVQGANFERDLILSGALFTAFIYLQLLLRDLDNPFEYNGKSSADINLEILTATLKRFQHKI